LTTRAALDTLKKERTSRRRIIVKKIFTEDIMKKTATVMGVFAMGCSLFLTCSTLTINPKRIACNEACAQARLKCVNDAKGNSAQIITCDAARDLCLQKCATEFP
jgi:hypothetical protein